MSLEKCVAAPCFLCGVEDVSNTTCENCLSEKQKCVGLCTIHRFLHEKPPENGIVDCYPYKIAHDPVKGRYVIVFPIMLCEILL